MAGNESIHVADWLVSRMTQLLIVDQTSIVTLKSMTAKDLRSLPVYQTGNVNSMCPAGGATELICCSVTMETAG